MTATKCIKACRRGQEVQLLFRPNVRMRKKYDLSDFDRGMIIGARQGGLSILETVDLIVHTQQGREFAENVLQCFAKNIQFCGQKRIVNEMGQRRRARLVKAGR